MALEERCIRRLLGCIFGERPFFVLGAGASSGLVPTTAEIRTIVKRDYLSMGIFGVNMPLRTDLHERVIGRTKEWRGEFSEVKLCTMPDSTLELLVQRSLWTPHALEVPAQYRVFDLLMGAAIFFNFNLDGLASRYLGARHIVLEAHGSIDHEFVNDAELIEATVAYDLETPRLRYKILPGPEPLTVTQGPAYRGALEFFPRASALIFVGYSFGQFQGRIDDLESFLFLMDLEKRYRKPVCVVSPRPSDVAERIEGVISQEIVTEVPARWEVLASAIERVTLRSCRATHEHRGSVPAAVMREYHYLEDASELLEPWPAKRPPLGFFLGIGESMT